MALPHAGPLEPIRVAPLGRALSATPSTSLIKSQRLQLLHVVLPAHQDQPEHQVDEECTIHCLEGQVELRMPGGVLALQAGELVLLPARQRHALRARSDCTVLVTLVLRHGETRQGGGMGVQHSSNTA